MSVDFRMIRFRKPNGENSQALVQEESIAGAPLGDFVYGTVLEDMGIITMEGENEDLLGETYTES